MNAEASQLPPVIATDASTMEDMFEALDVALDAYRRLSVIAGVASAHVNVSWCVRGDAPIREVTLRQWAARVGLDVEWSEFRYDNDTNRIRCLNVRCGEHRIAWVQWPIEPIEHEKETL